MSAAIGLFLTFTTYGTHLHGAESGSVDRGQRAYASPSLPPDSYRAQRAMALMQEAAFILDEVDRYVVLESMRTSTAYRNWQLFCAHVRTNHVHVVLRADRPAEQVLIYLKAKATVALKRLHPDRHRYWTKHGSTRHLWDEEALQRTICYVVNRQGTPLAVHSGA